ncbi:hypothetical protein C8Q73DRAFT_659190, partial [Cubamyces lactineus]
LDASPYLVSKMDWNAHKLYRYDGASKRWIRFVDEPMTADIVWQIQSELAPHQSPFVLILYADKTKLSSFGTAKGYPVIARCGNLPADIRNGDGPGGGRVVGWLPIVKEEAGERHKTGHVDFKRAVWHEAFRKILEPLRQRSHTGEWFICADEKERCLCPFIAILSADYEEQCFMSLIRGGKGLFPCPVCLVPKTQLSKYDMQWPKRTGEEAQRLLQEALAQRTLHEREAILQGWSLRPIQNAFLELAHSDPYKALSFDRLHAFHSGLFGHHLWPEFKKHVEKISHDAVKQIDVQYNNMPCWPGLTHFDEVMGLSFTDGGKYQNIANNLLFASHNVLTEEASPMGYMLLCAIRPFLELDAYIGLPLHTEWTLEDGEYTQMWFGAKLEEYKEFTANDEDSKNWEFPKAHTWQHVFDDIRAKGVSRNMDTKPNEKLHGPFKEAYRLCTNRRDVSPQLLAIDHKFYVAGHIQDLVNHYDAKHKAQSDNPQKAKAEPIGGVHFDLGAQRPATTIRALMAEHAGDIAFSNFPRRLGTFLTNAYMANNIPLPYGHAIKFTPESEVIEYRSLRVSYESMADWRKSTDLLRCNPQFHGHARYDSVLVRAEPDFIGRLLCIFTCNVGSTKQPIALILPYDRPSGSMSKKDADLGFYRVRERPRQQAEFISLHSLLRGVLLVPDFAKDGDFLVHDLLDSDIFLRMKSMMSSLQ